MDLGQDLSVLDLKQLLDVIPEDLPIANDDYTTNFKILVRSSSAEEMRSQAQEMAEAKITQDRS